MPMETESRHRIPVEELNLEIIAPVLRDLQTAHHLQGAFIPGSPPLVLIRAPSPNVTWEQSSFFSSRGFFGTGANLIAGFTGGSETIVHVPAGVEGFDTLAAERIRFATVFGNRILDAWEVADAPFVQVCEAGDGYQPDICDNAAHYWEVLASLRKEHPLRLSAKDQLSIGWVLRYRDEMRWAWRCLTDLRNLPALAPPKHTNSFPDLLFQEDVNLTQLMQCIEREVGCDFMRLHDIQNEWNVPGAANLPSQMWESHLFSPKLTDCGKRVPWVSSTSWQIEFLPLEVSDFPSGFPAENYWERMPQGSRVDWGTLVSAHDIHVSVELLTNEWGDFAGAENVEETSQCVDNLYAEAVTSKRGTIPKRAIVELPFGPFTHMELTEKGPNVFAVLRTAANEFCDVIVVPQDRLSSFCLPAIVPDSRRQAIIAGVKLLMAAIIRDFWVVEEREAVFDRHTTAGQKRQQRPLSDKPRIVYLPRVRYHERPDVQRCASNLGHAERRLHAVVPHLRRLADGRQASDHQKTLATIYGFHFDEGYTFVGPHQRGREKREVIYRSRSALNSLYTVRAEKPTDSKPDRWFQFERDVHKLMGAMGFAVEHVAASRHGDNGIDIYATKGHDLDQINWVIQCKCWHPKRKISPNIVRELVGVLAGYPHGTRGMVVATCSFSSGAIEAATAANIRLINGAEFMALVESTRVRDT